MGQKTDKIFERAKVNLNDDNHEQALRLFNEVLNREPSHKKALRNKALIKLLTGDEQEAEEFLLFAIDQRPKDDQLYQMLGSFYHNNDVPQKALAQFKKSININSGNCLSHKGLAMLYAKFYNDHENAVSHFTKAIDLNDQETELFFNRGCSYMILQDMKAAEKDLKHAADLSHDKASQMVEKYFS
jgi:tetratricopeptide (TPR) repeat protein